MTSRGKLEPRSQCGLHPRSPKDHVPLPPRAKSLNPRDRTLLIVDHGAIPSPPRQAIESTFLTTTELSNNPFDCSMTGKITYCSTFPEDNGFGVILNSFLFRWTSFCIANPEYGPEDMLKDVLYALVSSKFSKNPFLDGLILPLWEDTPWNSASIRIHRNMITLIRIQARHMRFLPVHRQFDESASKLSPSKWSVEFVLISNEAGREAYLDNVRIHTFLAHAI